MTATWAPSTGTTVARPPDAVEPRRATPVKWWAAIGASVLAVQAYTLTHWVVSGQATPTPTGSTAVPTWMLVSIRTFEAFSVVMAIAFAYFFLWRPWRREHRLTLDGMFMIIFLQMYFLQDPIYNYFHNSFSYSSVTVNLGSWTSSIPGWTSPRGHLM